MCIKAIMVLCLFSLALLYVQRKNLKMHKHFADITFVEKLFPGRLTVRKDRGPDLIGIGVRKCGTGVAMEFLELHGSFRFVKWGNYETEFFSKRRKLGTAWYKKRFRPTPKNKLAIEKTPHYFYAHPKTIPTDILSLNPNVKIFLFLCDPIARAYSCFVEHHLANFTRGTAKEEFEKYVSYWLPELESTFSSFNEEEAKHAAILGWSGKRECLLAGMYSLHIERWKKHFKESNFLILDGETMMKNPGPEYIKLQKFFGVPIKFRLRDWVKRNETGQFCLRPPDDRSSLFCQDNGLDKARTRSKTAEKPDLKTINALKRFYKPYNLKLFELLNRKFDWM